MVTAFIVTQGAVNLVVGYSLADTIHKHYGYKVWSSLKMAAINASQAYGANIYG